MKITVDLLKKYSLQHDLCSSCKNLVGGKYTSGTTNKGCKLLQDDYYLRTCLQQNYVMDCTNYETKD